MESDGTHGVFLFTPQLRWRSLGGGNWDTASNWTVGTKPGAPHSVSINPPGTLTVLGPTTSATIKQLTIGGYIGSGIATLQLQSGGTINSPLVIVQYTGILTGDGTIAGTVLSQGTVRADNVTITGTLINLSGSVVEGNGRVNVSLDNGSNGRVTASAGEHLRLNGASHSNNGRIETLGTAGNPAEIEFTGTLTNAASLGLITGRSAIMRFNTGLTNMGSLALTGGANEVFGDINNTGSIVVSGGAAATFYDDVTQNGALRVSKVGSTNSVAEFLGSFTGAGGSTGGGDIFFEGDLRPGNSPAAVSFGNNIGLGSGASLKIELGGTTPGSGPNNHDQVNVTGTASLGGTLDLVPFNGFVPVSGDEFVVMTYGSASGTFSTVTGTNPAPGLTYTPVYSSTNLTILTTTTGEKTWAVDSSGNASVGSNWTGGVAPGGIGDSATFSTIITAPRVVTLDADTTAGTLKFDSPISYTLAGPHTLTLQAFGGNEANINVLNLHGNGAHMLSAPITLASNLNIANMSSGTFRLSGPINDSAARMITKAGVGTVEITAAPTLGAGTAIKTGAGTLRFAATSGSPMIGTGVSVAVNGFGTLELAGSVSALASSGNRANITNSSSAAVGILVTGTNQVVGAIDGAGTTQVNAGSDLTANHVIQGALVIGGAVNNPAIVTIAASDAAGNSLGQAVSYSSAAQSVSSLAPVAAAFGSTSADAEWLAAGNDFSLGSKSELGLAMNSANLFGGAVAVPEPSALVLSGIGLLAGSIVARQKRRQSAA